MLRLICVLIAGLLLGFVTAVWSGNGRTPSATADLSSLAGELREDQARLASKITEQLADMRRHIDELGAVAHSPLPPREPALMPTSEAPRAPNDLDQRIARIEQSLAGLTKAVEAHGNLVLYPKVEEVRAARKVVDRSLIGQISAALVRDHEAGEALVRYLTFAEVLERFGAPTMIREDGTWMYERREGETLGPADFSLEFINGYVMTASSSDEQR